VVGLRSGSIPGRGRDGSFPTTQRTVVGLNQLPGRFGHV
jgi:hypothetical protein